MGNWCTIRRPNIAEVAELVDAPDLGSGILWCESSSLSFRTIFFIPLEISPERIARCSKELI
jgi:hypothetical protein